MLKLCIFLKDADENSVGLPSTQISFFGVLFLIECLAPSPEKRVLGDNFLCQMCYTLFSQNITINVPSP